LDSEYTLVVDVIDVMASAKSRTLFAAAGTSAFSAAGAAKLYESPSVSVCDQTTRKTYAGAPECWIRRDDSSDCVIIESWGYTRRTSRFQ
jgi:hypothetical protein